MTQPGNGQRTYRLSRAAYLVVLFLLIGVTPVVQRAVLAVVYLVPILAAAFIARVGTHVGPDGLQVRALLGSRTLPWQDVRGLSVGGRHVYAVTNRGTFRLPCVRINDLPAIARISGGRLPTLRDPVPKFAPSGRRRR